MRGHFGPAKTEGTDRPAPRPSHLSAGSNPARANPGRQTRSRRRRRCAPLHLGTTVPCYLRGPRLPSRAPTSCGEQALWQEAALGEELVGGDDPRFVFPMSRFYPPKGRRRRPAPAAAPFSSLAPAPAGGRKAPRPRRPPPTAYGAGSGRLTGLLQSEATVLFTARTR